MEKPREGFLSWDEYFMFVALLTAQRSKDPSTQVGACIVNDRQHIVAVGYNGFPRGIDSDELPWDRDNEDALYNKYMYVSHAEENAIDNRGSREAYGARIYVSLYPCNVCAKRIIQNGIKEVVYMSDKYHNEPPFIAARRLFEKAGVATRQLKITSEILLKMAPEG